jgi:hypothetical protein
VRAISLFAIAAATTALVGCEDSIHRGWLVDRTRILGARTFAMADPGRASLEPGELARIDWLVAAPEGLPALAWSFAACAAPEGNFPEPKCDAALLASGSGAATGEIIAMDFEVPPAAALGNATELLFLAAFCADGAPALDARAFAATCASGEPLLASMMVRLASAGANQNPPPPSVSLGNVVLPEGDPAAPGAPCDAAPAAPAFAAGGPTVDLVYVFDGTEREPNESMMLSTVVTGGELDRQYSAFDAEEAPPKEVRVPWTPPTQDGLAAAGRIVRFYVFLRDGRGGASFGRFSVCVRPS